MDDTEFATLLDRIQRIPTNIVASPLTFLTPDRDGIFREIRVAAQYATDMVIQNHSTDLGRATMMLNTTLMQQLNPRLANALNSAEDYARYGTTGTVRYYCDNCSACWNAPANETVRRCTYCHSHNYVRIIMAREYAAYPIWDPANEDGDPLDDDEDDTP